MATSDPQAETLRRPDAERIRAEVERLAADTARLRGLLGPGDPPDLLVVLHARG